MSADPREVVDVYEQLEAEKGTLRSHLQEIADYMVPSAQSSFTQLTIGSKKMSKIYDGTAIRSLRMFANGLYGHLSSPSYPWFELTVKNKQLTEIPSVKFWLADSTEKMRAAINSSNAPTALHEVYKQEGWIGTGVLFIEPGRKYLLNFQAFNAVNCCITEDANGVVDGLYRLEKFTARNCIQKFGDRCSETIKKAYREDKKRSFDIIHGVYARNDYNWRKENAENMPYASVYVEKETRNLLSEGGFKEFPYAVPRWEKEEGNPYGSSPAMDALPDVKMLNQMCYDNMRGIQKMIDPPILASKESALSSTRTAPGSVIYHKSGEKPEPFLSGGRFDWALQVEEQRRVAIEKAFYTDLFMLLAESNDPQKTAYEVRQLIEEKLTLLGPALGRQQSELFDPMLARVFWILYRAGILLPAPPELLGQGLEVNYIGRLALAMKSTETNAAASTLSFIGTIAQAKPQIWDNFDEDEIAQGTAMRSGMPVKYIRTPESRDKIRQARAEALRRQQELAEASAIADKVPALSKAPEPGSMAAQVLNQGAA